MILRVTICNTTRSSQVNCQNPIVILPLQLSMDHYATAVCKKKKLVESSKNLENNFHFASLPLKR